MLSNHTTFLPKMLRVNQDGIYKFQGEEVPKPQTTSQSKAAHSMNAFIPRHSDAGPSQRNVIHQLIPLTTNASMSDSPTQNIHPSANAATDEHPGRMTPFDSAWTNDDLLQFFLYLGRFHRLSLAMAVYTQNRYCIQNRTTPKTTFIYHSVHSHPQIP